MLVSYKSAQPQKLPKEHEGKSESELNALGFVICPEKPEITPGQKLWWENNAWVIQEPNEAELAVQWQAVKNEVARLLEEADRYVIIAYEKGQKTDNSIVKYRKQLRKVAGQPNPFAITWPIRPTIIDGHAIVEWNYEKNPPEKSDIDQERDRRIYKSFFWNGFEIQSDRDSIENILGACSKALIFITTGGDPNNPYWTSPTEKFTWIAADNSIVELTPAQMLAMGSTAAEHKKNCIFAARSLKDMNPIPLDFQDDKWWVQSTV